MKYFQISTSDLSHNNYFLNFRSEDLNEVYGRVQDAINTAEGELAHGSYKVNDYLEVVIEAVELDDDGDWIGGDWLDVINVKKGFTTTFDATTKTWTAEPED